MAARRAEPPVVVLGGGFGGLFTTYHLTAGAGRERRPVLMVSKEEEFVFKPLLPEAVGAASRPSFLTNNLPRLAKAWRFDFQHAEVRAIDLKARHVETSDGTVAYGDLVLALGSIVDTHGVDLSAPHVFRLHDLDDGPRLRAHVKRQVQRAVRAKSARAQKRALHFVGIGAGPTGIETIAEVQEYLHACFADANATRLQNRARFTIVEAGKVILGDLPSRVREEVMAVLTRRGIRVAVGAPAVEIVPEGCRLADDEILESETVVWAAGVRAQPVVGELAMRVDGLGRIRVDNYLRARGQVDVFALGDNACCLGRKRRLPLPATGQVAVQQAKVVAANIRRAHAGQPLRPFVYKELGRLVPLGKGEAAGSVLGRNVKGLPAWLASRGAYMAQVLGMDNRMGLAWGWGRQAMAQSLLRPLWR